MASVIQILTLQLVLNKLVTKGRIFAFFKDIWGNGLATLEDCKFRKKLTLFLDQAFIHVVIQITTLFYR